MITFFKNNNPSSYVFLPLFALVLWGGGFFIKHEGAAYGMPLYNGIEQWVGSYGIIATAFAFLLMVGEAFLLNFIVNENAVLSKPSFLPALLYIVFMSCDTHLLTLYPLLFSNLFILFAIHRLTSSYRLDKAFSHAFDTGVLLSLATLFYFPSSALFALLPVGLVLFRPFIWREWVIALIGVVVPYTFVFTYYLWNDMLADVWQTTIIYPQPNYMPLGSPEDFYVTLTVCAVVLALSVLRLFSGFLETTQKNKKGIILLLWLSLFAILSVFLAPQINLRHFMLLAIPAAVFSANYFLRVKSGRWGEFLFLLLLIGVIVGHIFGYQG